MTIANNIKGRDFCGLLGYLLKDSQKAVVLGGQVYGGAIESAIENASTVTAENRPALIAELLDGFNDQAALNQKVGLRVRHFSLAFSPEDGHVSRDLKLQIAQSFMKEMGYEKNLWLAVDHSFTDHGHLHIAAVATDCDGKRISDSHDYGSSRLALQQIEQDFSLAPLLSNIERLAQAKKKETLLFVSPDRVSFNLDEKEIEMLNTLLDASPGDFVPDSENISVIVNGEILIDVDASGLVTQNALIVQPTLVIDFSTYQNHIPRSVSLQPEDLEIC